LAALFHFVPRLQPAQLPLLLHRVQLSLMLLRQHLPPRHFPPDLQVSSLVHAPPSSTPSGLAHFLPSHLKPDLQVEQLPLVEHASQLSPTVALQHRPPLQEPLAAQLSPSLHWPPVAMVGSTQLDPFQLVPLLHLEQVPEALQDSQLLLTEALQQLPAQRPLSLQTSSAEHLLPVGILQLRPSQE
jgi:hypothetical protein